MVPHCGFILHFKDAFWCELTMCYLLRLGVHPLCPFLNGVCCFPSLNYYFEIDFRYISCQICALEILSRSPWLAFPFFPQHCLSLSFSFNLQRDGSHQTLFQSVTWNWSPHPFLLSSFLVHICVCVCDLTVWCSKLYVSRFTYPPQSRSEHFCHHRDAWCCSFITISPALTHPS